LFEIVETPDGPFGILADVRGRVLSSGWTSDVEGLRARLTPALRPDADSIVRGPVGAASDAVRSYYEGDLAAIDSVEVVQSGGEFHMAAWARLRDIAPGHPLTYQEFAAANGRPTAVRAAASACARNAPALFVPCHRVLRTDGALGGFAWGLDVKRSLLAREAAA
jgi:O-6-methylguanine DNA methyltransferase